MMRRWAQEGVHSSRVVPRAVQLNGFLHSGFSMFVHPEFDPIAVSIGPVAIRWYGLMYLLAFVAFIMLAKRRLHLFPAIKMSDVDNMLTWAVLGVILGGRLGYVFFTSLTIT